ncbi:hypothetical protein CUC08_Gglean013408 [Alternaria sp. MG1]|nr:hypothetical protein CUC08_Gglean013408 [Alternaria sp. MG1]
MAAIKVFMHDNKKHLYEFRLTSDDWDILQKAHTFLQPFASATLYAEGDKSSISQSLLIMDSLLVHLLQATKGTPPLMKESGQNANRRPRQKVMINAGR